MQRIIGGAGNCAVFGFLLVAMTAYADDKKDDVKIPSAVMDTLKAKWPQAKTNKATKEKEGDAEVYDIEFTVAGKKWEADIKEDGTLVNFEMEFSAKKLPKAVTDAVAKKYPKSTLKVVMECTDVKDGKETHAGFEITLDTADNKEVEVQVAKNGKILEDSTEKKK